MLRVKKESFYVKEVTCEPTQGWGLVARRTSQVIRGLNFQSREGRRPGGWIHHQYPKI